MFRERRITYSLVEVGSHASGLRLSGGGDHAVSDVVVDAAERIVAFSLATAAAVA